MVYLKYSDLLKLSNSLGAGTLSFELSTNEEKLITNCGGSENLGKNPEWQEKVRNEIFSIKNEMPTFDDMSAMTLTEYVFQETLRFYPSVMILNRRTTRDVHINGYDIPAHTMIMLSPPFTHRMEEWWTNPLEFDPMRFSPERADDKRHGFN